MPNERERQMSDDDERDPEIRAFGLPVPKELVQALVNDHQQAHMRQDAALMAIQHFFDSLSVEQLMVLRRIRAAVLIGAQNQFMDGQVYQILRLVHGVDPDTGRAPHEELKIPKP